jgi:hypothetical protein
MYNFIYIFIYKYIPVALKLAVGGLGGERGRVPADPWGPVKSLFAFMTL